MSLRGLEPNPRIIQTFPFAYRVSAPGDDANCATQSGTAALEWMLLKKSDTR